MCLTSPLLASKLTRYYNLPQFISQLELSLFWGRYNDLVETTRSLKGLLNRRVFAVCLESDTESHKLWMGLVSEISWPEMKSIAGNDNKRELSRICSISSVFLFLEINFTQIETSMTVFALCCFNITISWKWYVFYRNWSVHVISFKKGSWKNIEF